MEKLAAAADSPEPAGCRASEPVLKVSRVGDPRCVEGEVSEHAHTKYKCRAAEPAIAISEQTLEKLYTTAEAIASGSEKSLLQEVKSLGHYPIEIQKPQSEDEKREKLMRKRLNRHKSSQSREAGEYLRALESFSHAEAKRAANRSQTQDLLAKIRRLGRTPRELKTTENEESKDEHNLARRLRDARAARVFTETEEAELVSIGETELETLIWNAYSAEGETMVELYVAAKELIRNGVKLQSSYDEQLLEELEWRVQREHQTDATEYNAQRRGNLESIKETINAIQKSTVRCTCHDFFNWRDLWRADPHIARRLRDTGHHLPDCLLAQVTSTLARTSGKTGNEITPTTAPEELKFKVLARHPNLSGYMLVTSCLDHVDTWLYSLNGMRADILLEKGSTSPYGDGFPEFLRRPVEAASDSEPEPGASEPTKDGDDEDFGDPAQIKSCFVGHGVFSACQQCKSTIEAGIIYYGCRKEQNEWTAAGQELSFHHFMGSCVSLDSDIKDDENPFPRVHIEGMGRANPQSSACDSWLRPWRDGACI
jgi:hypothetical protein